MKEQSKGANQLAHITYRISGSHGCGDGQLQCLALPRVVVMVVPLMRSCEVVPLVLLLYGYVARMVCEEKESGTRVPVRHPRFCSYDVSCSSGLEVLVFDEVEAATAQDWHVS